MATPIVWADIDLCLDKDLAEYESEIYTWVESKGSAQEARGTAKKEIAEKLRLALKDVELLTDATEVLDLLGNPEVLRISAAYLTIHLIALDKTVGLGDMYDRKAEIYLQKFDRAFKTALSLIHVDTDESGVIDDGEKYNFPANVRFTRGGI